MTATKHPAPGVMIDTMRGQPWLVIAVTEHKNWDHQTRLEYHIAHRAPTKWRATAWARWHQWHNPIPQHHVIHQDAWDL